MKIAINKRKIAILVIGVVLIVTVAFSTMFPWDSLGWEKKFTLKELEYNDKIEAVQYSITNETNYSYRVTAVIQCNSVGDKWEYEKYVVDLGPHATDTFYVYWDDLLETKPNENQLFMAVQTIQRLKYEKR